MRYRFLRFPEGKYKAVTLSYDDGCRPDIKMSQIISRYGLKCTYNINSGWYGKDSNDWHLTRNEIKEHLLDKGHEIAVHGEFHKAPGIVRTADGIRDVLNCRLALEKDFGIIVRGMAYPDCGITRMDNGTTYEKVKNYLTELDITYSRTLGGDNDSFDMPKDWHAWMPTMHHNNPNALAWAEKFVGLTCPEYHAAHSPKLMYMWGHSYEFDRDNSWDLLEKLCETLSGKDDIWYATNGEIYDYVAAYNALICSADGLRIYNPTLMDVWFVCDGKPYCVHSGETVVIEE